MIILSSIFGIIGMFCILVLKDNYKLIKTKQDYKPLPKKDVTICYTISIICIIGFIICCSSASNSGSSRSTSGVKGSPWEDLGVSQKEYMDTYKYIKSHGTK